MTPYELLDFGFVHRVQVLELMHGRELPNVQPVWCDDIWMDQKYKHDRFTMIYSEANKNR